MEQPRTRFAVPLEALEGESRVELTDQMAAQAPASVPWPPTVGVPYGNGGDVDGDGD